MSSNRLLTNDTGVEIVDAIKLLIAVEARKSVGLRPVSYADIQAIVRMGIAPLVFNIGDIIQVARESDIQASLGEHTGISAVELNGDTFIAAVGETGEKEYEVTFDGSAWRMDGSLIILSDYGLSVTGTPAEGDTIVIVETASIINFVVMGFIDNGQNGAIKIKDKNLKYGMILQAEDATYSVQYDAAEAIYYAAEGLVAGTYHIQLGQEGYDADNGGGKTYQFALTQDVPAGGQLAISWAANTQASAAKIKSYASASDTTGIETVSIAEGDDGTDLGIAYSTEIVEGSNINLISRARYGSNRWKTSAVRQQLNSDAAAGSVWSPQTVFDRPPSWVSSMRGFIRGIDPGFLSIVAPVEIETILNTICDTTTAEASAGTGYDVTVDRFFLPSTSEVHGAKQNASDHGVAWPFYAANSAYASANNGTDPVRIKRNPATKAAVYQWLRDPSVGSGDYPRYVTTTGQVYNYHSAISASWAAQACIVA